jgi:hypothetical protein
MGREVRARAGAGNLEPVEPIDLSQGKELTVSIEEVLDRTAADEAFARAWGGRARSRRRRRPDPDALRSAAASGPRSRSLRPRPRSPFGPTRETGEGGTMGRKLQIEWEVPDDAFGPGFEEEAFVSTVKEVAIMRLLRDSRISQGKAAGLLGVGRHELFDLLGRYDIPSLDLTPEELERDRRHLRDAPR